MAVAVRGGRDAIAGVILHTDQGVHRRLVRAACDRLGIRQSMGRPGSALDNAVIGSWHSTWSSSCAAWSAERGGGWMRSKHDRRHSALGMLSPIAYERSRTTLDDPPEQAA